MQWWPYQGPQRTLYTELGVDECLDRLRDDVIRSWPLSRWTGISPFKRDRAATRDQLVFRAIAGHQVRLHLEGGRANNRYVQYVFAGSIQLENGRTTITGQYQLQRFSFVGLTLLYGLAAATAFIGAAIIVATLRESSAAWQEMLFGVSFLLGAVAILAGIPSRASVLSDERLVIDSIKRLLEAQEANAREPT